jgi:hypothetical protein
VLPARQAFPVGLAAPEKERAEEDMVEADFPVKASALLAGRESLGKDRRSIPKEGLRAKENFRGWVLHRLRWCPDCRRRRPCWEYQGNFQFLPENPAMSRCRRCPSRWGTVQPRSCFRLGPWRKARPFEDFREGCP